MRRMQLDFHNEDTISFGGSQATTAPKEQVNTRRRIDYLERVFPSFACTSDYPPSVQIERLKETVPVEGKYSDQQNTV